MIRKSRSMLAYNQRYELALRLASQAHDKQLRKGSSIPYISHVVHVARILERHGFGEELILAGLLHDVVEDTDLSLEDVRARFGDRVAQLVDAVTERKAEDGVERPWEVRKAESLEKLRVADANVAALKAADAIHNGRTTCEDLVQDGPVVWKRFKRGPEVTRNYYAAIADIARQQLGAHAIVLELDEVVSELSRLIE